MQIAALFGFILGCQAVGLLGSIPNIRVIPNWYATLRKPSWTPPNRVFAPVWTLLYLLMAVSAWRCWMVSGFHNWSASFGIQLALNCAWSWVFFGLKRIGAALAEMTVLWISVIWCMVEMSAVDTVAPWLIGPYLLWITYAYSLNAGFWVLNRGGRAPGSLEKSR